MSEQNRQKSLTSWSSHCKEEDRQYIRIVNRQFSMLDSYKVYEKETEQNKIAMSSDFLKN